MEMTFRHKISITTQTYTAQDENFVLTLHSAGLKRSERAISVAFNPLQRYISAGTRDGVVAMWKYVGDYSSSDGSDQPEDDSSDPSDPHFSKYDNKKTKVQTSSSQWKPMPSVTVQGAVRHLQWGPGQGLLAAGTDSGATMLSETVLHRSLNDGVAAIQINNDTVNIETQDNGNFLIHTDINVKGVVVDSSHMVVWNGKEAQVYGLGDTDTSRRQVSERSEPASLEEDENASHY